MGKSFSDESSDYHATRDRLVVEEVALRRQMEAMSASADHGGSDPLGLSRRCLLWGAVAASLAGCTRSQTGIGNHLEAEWLTVNGTRQWLVVKGAPRIGPVVLILHGGPGASETLLFRHFNRALEDHFRIAYWDQRGAGLSYDAASPPRNLTVAQVVSDLGVVVEYLRQKLKAPVVLLGHSWGSALGLLYAHRSPEAVKAVIGVGQVADQAEQEQASYAFALSEARRRRNEKAVRELEAIGRPPFDVPALLIKNRWVERFGGYFAAGFDKYGLAFKAVLSGEAGIGEIRHSIAANEFTLKTMWPEVRSLNIPGLVPKLGIPAAFLLGRFDHQCPSNLAAAYFGKLRAPDKTLRWFEKSAHNIPFEQPLEFNAAIVDLVDQWAN